MSSKRRLAGMNMAACRKPKYAKPNKCIATHAVRYLTTDAWAYSIPVCPPDPMIFPLSNLTSSLDRKSVV